MGLQAKYWSVLMDTYTCEERAYNSRARNSKLLVFVFAPIVLSCIPEGIPVTNDFCLSIP